MKFQKPFDHAKHGRRVIQLLELLFMNDADVVTLINGVTAAVASAEARINAKIAALTAAQQNAPGTTTPEEDQAMAALQSEVNNLGAIVPANPVVSSDSDAGTTAAP